MIRPQIHHFDAWCLVSVLFWQVAGVGLVCAYVVFFCVHIRQISANRTDKFDSLFRGKSAYFGGNEQLQFASLLLAFSDIVIRHYLDVVRVLHDYYYIIAHHSNINVQIHSIIIE